VQMMRLPAVALVLVSFAHASHAQSSVTIYGHMNLGVARNIGSNAIVVQQGSQSRLGFSGVEDLGGGLKASFALEHRFQADTGGPLVGPFWYGRSIVGLGGDFGLVTLGRDLTSAYLTAQLLQDPFLNQTVASMVAMSTGGIAQLRNDNALKYTFQSAGLTLRAEVGDGEVANASRRLHRPVSAGVSYASGPLYLAYGYDNGGGDRDFWHSATVHYKWAGVLLRAGIGSGKTNADRERRSWIVGATVPVSAAGEIRVAHGELEERGPTVLKMVAKTGIGYYYSLSKRTFLYTNIAHDSRAVGDRVGVDVGIGHSF
jgi:general bacterial porin, GBP family